jgi:hypothetical protein
MSGMDHDYGKGSLEEQWRRYIAARNKALAARSPEELGTIADCWMDREALDAEAPIA